MRPGLGGPEPNFRGADDIELPEDHGIIGMNIGI